METLSGVSGGTSLGDMGFEFVNSGGAFDTGLSSFYIASAAHDGTYKFGDSALNGITVPVTVNLWVRQEDYAGHACPVEPCTFQIGKRYMTVRLVPTDSTACIYK